MYLKGYGPQNCSHLTQSFIRYDCGARFRELRSVYAKKESAELRCSGHCETYLQIDSARASESHIKLVGKVACHDQDSASIEATPLMMLSSPERETHGL